MPTLLDVQSVNNNPNWRLLGSFGRLIEAAEPDVVSMENVPRLATIKNGATFNGFLRLLDAADYDVVWDNSVSITLDKAEGKITIEDTGVGMDRDAVIDRFLTVGFRRRDELGATTDAGRKPMGRKGIGKLSIFSIAQMANVYTVSGKAKPRSQWIAR